VSEDDKGDYEAYADRDQTVAKKTKDDHQAYEERNVLDDAGEYKIQEDKYASDERIYAVRIEGKSKNS